ncbi:MULTISPECIES: AAA family ATPase [Rhodococcus]|uniref:AAA family ATPase n=1 Tax=Rhodococcus TaxID=1827 RepID=UPI001F1EC318|nr:MULTISPECIES: SMC family ATPase [Rhodococcus]MCF8786286.1 SMC family ATPase [Rhodococcus ruber]UTM40074.1 SMC family ATPase [Rhodococcus pyridinivorans]
MQIITGHIYNYRSIEDLTLDFEADGIHALIGAPGSGKSSFLGAIGFALYGDPGPGIDLIDLRNDNADTKAPAGADITWRQGQDTYRTVREMRRGVRGGKPIEKTTARMWHNGVEIEHMTPTLMTAEVTRILGMSGRAFRGANMIAQGEVDTLATATPTEVTALVEEHTGVSHITKLRDRARKDAGDKQAIADAALGSPDAVAQAELREREAEKAHSDAEADASAANAKAARARADWEQLNAKVRDLRDQERCARQARESVVAASAVADAAERRLAELHTLIADQGLADARPEDLEDRITDLREAAHAITTAGANLSAAENTLEAAEREAAAAERSAASIDVTRVQAQLTTAQTDRQRAEEALRAADRQQATARSEASKLAKAIHVLRDSAGEAHCPTCRQSIDDLDDLVTDLDRQRSAADRAAQDAAATVTNMTAQRRAADTAASEAQRLLQYAEQAQRHIEQTQQRLHTARTARSRGLDELVAVLRSLDADLLPPLPSDVTAQTCLDIARTALASVNERGQLLQASRQLLLDRAAAEAELADATHTLREAQAAVVNAPDPAAVTAAESAATEARTHLDDLDREASDARAMLAAAQTGLLQVSDDADLAREHWRRKRVALREAEVARGIADSLTALRQDLLADYAQQISESATELLQRFGGEHVAFHLDSDFVPHVELIDGRRRKLKLLSGGEKARAGLAFRLGISMQVTDGGLPDQIFGDEITQYLDDEGRRAIVETIGELFASPILISHTDEVLDYATSVHELTRDLLGATEVVAATH